MKTSMIFQFWGSDAVGPRGSDVLDSFTGGTRSFHYRCRTASHLQMSYLSPVGALAVVEGQRPEQQSAAPDGKSVDSTNRATPDDELDGGQQGDWKGLTAVSRSKMTCPCCMSSL